MRYDLMTHALIFGLLACIPVKLKKWVIAVLLITPFLCELEQFFMNTRTPDIEDALAGACTAAAVICLRILYGEIAPVVRRYRQRRKHWKT